MRAKSLFALASAFFLFASVAASAADYPTLAGITTTDDCFNTYGGDNCAFSYCIGFVAGDKEELRSENFNACAKPTGTRVLASQETACGNEK